MTGKGSLPDNRGKENIDVPELVKPLDPPLQDQKLEKSMQTDTRDAARKTLEHEPEKQVTFKEAVGILEGKLDLDKALIDAIKSHKRWGFVDYFIFEQQYKLNQLKWSAEASEDPEEKSSILESIKRLEQYRVQNIEDYKNLFYTTTFRESELQAVLKNVEAGHKVLPIFDIGQMALDELFDALIVFGGVPCDKENLYKKLATVRRIEPSHIANLENLHKKSIDEQHDAFAAAYKAAKPLRAHGPRIVFTTDEQRITHTNTSSVKDMQAAANGTITILDPFADLYRLRIQIDNGLRKVSYRRRKKLDEMDTKEYRELLIGAFVNIRFKKRMPYARTIDQFMPDQGQFIRYANYVFEEGNVLTFRYIDFLHTMHVGAFAPFEAYYNLGSRVALG